ncbi:MAG TPA: thiamine pyrophosphate-binding protein [Dehalococcoidia bacterium]|nr:thiamine pyrophosphate-binding protein [Dehalococcoidia bacterium]
MEEKPEVTLGMREMYPYPAMYIADVLKEHNVEVAFGVHGGHIWQIVDAMSTAGIKIVTVRHEQSGVYAAEAYSKITGKPGIAFATVGPGTANIVSAVQQAYLSRSPLIVLLGGHEIQVDRLYTTIQEAYAPDLMTGITKWTQRVVHPSQYKQFVTRAFKEALSYPKGPVVLEFSLDGLWTPIPPAAKPSVFGEHAKYRPHWLAGEIDRPLSPGADPALVERVVDLIYQAERPLIYAGDGVHWSNAAPELVEFAELSQIPTTNRRIARGAMPEVHPLFFPSRAGKGLIKEADLLITLGMKVGFFEGYGSRWPKVIQVSESAEHIWTFLDTSEAVVGSPKVVLQQMIDLVKKRRLKVPASRQQWVARAQGEAKAAWQRLSARADKYKDHKRIHHGWLSKVIAETMEEMYGGRNRVMVDGYTISDFCPPFLRARYSGQIMDASEQAGIGHGIGMSIGAAFADRETKTCPIVALMGDAGIGVAGMDIETALRFKLPIVYLITNNNGWLISLKYSHYGKDWQAMGQQDHGLGQECLPDIRYDKMFEALGCYTEQVTEPDKIKDSLKRAFKAAENGQTAVLNIMVDPSVGNSSIYSFAYTMCMAHIPWNKLAKRGKAARRNILRMLPWDIAGVPPMPMPDAWEPVREDEMLP